MAQCASGRPCLWWVERFLRDCVCGVRGYLSLVFGLLSVFIWAVAEIPQIVTNFRSGSTEGLSLAFLIAWLAGCRDLLNLIRCLLDRATLPSQLYTALIYTIATAILVGQNLYYEYIRKWLKQEIQHQQHSATTDGSEQHHENIKGEPVIANSETSSNVISTRSLGSNDKPECPRASSLEDSPYCQRYKLNPSSIYDEGSPSNRVSSRPMNSNTRLRCVAVTIFFVAGLNYLHVQSFHPAKVQRSSVVLRGRKILEHVNRTTRKQSKTPIGIWLGWLMTAIAAGGQLSQICLNVKRGAVEGLSPLMFMFGLIGDATYIGSIIIRTLEWKRLEPNMPWIVNAGVGVVLDFLTLAQIMYYK